MSRAKCGQRSRSSAEPPRFASQGVGLTGKASANNVNCVKVPAVDGSDIAIAPHVRPMLGEHRARIVVDFDLPLNLEPGALKAQVEPADPAEERPDRQRARH